MAPILSVACRKRASAIVIVWLQSYLIFPASSVMWGDEAGPSSAEFALVPAGTFTMGSPPSENGRFADEALHEVTIEQSFYLGRGEVNWTLWNEVRDWALDRGYTDLVAGNNGFSGSEDGTHPVSDVSWWDAVYWCNARSEREGRVPVYYRSEDFDTGSLVRSGLGEVFVNWEANGYRLPTEAEWEYACRAGRQTAYYSGVITAWENGCHFDKNLNAMGWYCANSEENTRPFGEKQANGFGLSDMHGNVFEWCWDWYGPYESIDSRKSPTGPQSGAQRVQRGGSWMNSAAQARAAYRHPLAPSTVFYNAGFRLAISNTAE